MTTTARERTGGAILVAFALGYAALARGYVVSFLADPLGPRAAPFLLAALLVALGGWLVWKPAPADDAVAPARSHRSVVAVAAFIAYAALLPWIGFVLCTALLTALLARLADGPVVRALACGGAFAGVLYYLFVFALDVPLPIGRVFPFLGG